MQRPKAGGHPRLGRRPAHLRSKGLAKWSPGPPCRTFWASHSLAVRPPPALRALLPDGCFRTALTLLPGPPFAASPAPEGTLSSSSVMGIEATRLRSQLPAIEGSTGGGEPGSGHGKGQAVSSGPAE